MILKSNLDGLSCADDHFLEIELVRRHGQLGDSEIGYELNSVRRPVLEIDRNDALDLSELGVLPSCVDDIE